MFSRPHSLFHQCFSPPDSPLLPNDFLQEIPRKPTTLLERFPEPLIPAIVRIGHGLRLRAPAVLPKQHDLGLRIRVPSLRALQVRQVRAVHCENVVEFLEVGCAEL